MFEIAKDEHHDHFQVCDQCGKIIEFHNEEIEKLQEKVALEHGFKLAGHSLVMHGICNDEKCRNAGKK